MSQWNPDDDDLVDELPAPPRKSIPEADRELLHLAARAIGAVRVEDVEGEQWLILHFADGTEAHGWNPLLFYSDTFEIVVRLHLHFHAGEWMEAGVANPEFDRDLDPERTKWLADEKQEADPCAAAARAVVRSAAEIGKQRS